ncbi:hypothetical protein H0H92_001387, partial [Tricholoma furcatifolium]
TVRIEDKIVTQYKYMKAIYKSAVSWFAETDKIRCNPLCYGKERFDCVLVHSVPQDVFYRLVFVFTVKLKANPSDPKATIAIPLAVAIPYQDAAKPGSLRDRDLRLLRIRQLPRSKAQIIPMR